MNILPKKSWHVRNKDNVAKVRRDEEEARTLEQKRLQQVALAEQEARTELLRKKARKSISSDNVLGLAVKATSHQPINFFQDVGPDGKPFVVSAKNSEHEEEKRQEKEKAEKKIGLLTYLGQSAVETLPDDERPWYFKPPDRNKTSPDHHDLSKSIKDSKRKASLDPLADMNKHLKKKKKSKKKHKHDREKPNSSKSHAHPRSVPSSEDKLAKLRKQRLEREAKEKQRSVQLLQKHYGINEDLSKPSKSSYVPKYSNQFNPHLARNNKYT